MTHTHLFAGMQIPFRGMGLVARGHNSFICVLSWAATSVRVSISYFFFQNRPLPGIVITLEECFLWGFVEQLFSESFSWCVQIFRREFPLSQCCRPILSCCENLHLWMLQAVSNKFRAVLWKTRIIFFCFFFSPKFAFTVIKDTTALVSDAERWQVAVKLQLFISWCLLFFRIEKDLP